MENNKSSLLYNKRAKSSRKLLKYKISNNIAYKDKRRSSEMNINNYLNKFKKNQKSKLNKIPMDQRLSLQNLNNINFSQILKNKNNKIETLPQKRDKNYYLNLINEIYLSDTHLSNKKKIIKFDKDIPNKFSKFRSSKNISFKFGSKSTNKKYNLISNEHRNKSHKKIKNDNNNIKDEKSISKNTGNFSLETKNKNVKKKYLSTKTASKFKTSNKSINKNKSSFNDNDKNENLNDTLKDEKNNEMINEEIKSMKKICKFSNKEIQNDNKNKEKEGIEMNSHYVNKDISKKKTGTNPKIRKFQCCFFCCLTENDKDDSYSDNI